MAEVFTLQPNPHWVIIDDFSKLPNGAAIYTYRSLNPTEFKPAFQDAGGTIPYGEFIQGFGNGTMPPIFWEFDDTTPEETYYIQVYSAPKDQGGLLLWDFDGLSGESGGGGGTIITNNDVENLIINGEFYRNAGNQVSSPSINTQITLAPSNNSGIGGYANSVNDGPVLPDIVFAKNNQTDSDALSFVPVTPIGSNNLGLNPTPQFYVNYTCTVAGTAQTYKYFQFPIVKGLQNLSGATVSTQIYARLNSGSTTDVQMNLRQFFGNGGSPSADVLTPIGGGPIPLILGAWTKIIINSQVIPSISGKTLGSCGNDTLFTQINLPLSNTINIDFILPAMYLGTVTSNTNFSTLDKVDSVVNSPRTGDTRTTINDVLLGWLIMDDGTIGNGSSNATARANIDTFFLYDLIWTRFQATQTLAPMFNSSGSPIAYGASSVADFTANNQLALTRNLGRVMVGALPTSVSRAFTNTGNVMTVSSTASYNTGAPAVVSGGGLPTPLVAGTTYYVIRLSSTTMSLATTPANAIAGTAITLTTNASGTVTVPAIGLGEFGGEVTHTQSIAELPSHTHGGLSGNSFFMQGAGGLSLPVAGANAATAGTTAATGSGTPFNIMQPYVGMNVFIKL